MDKVKYNYWRPGEHVYWPGEFVYTFDMESAAAHHERCMRLDNIIFRLMRL